MRFIIMHQTNAHWEAGAIPGRPLIERVGALIKALSNAGMFESGEGLRPSSEGVRITFTSGARSIAYGPFSGPSAAPAGFTILRARSLDEAIEWATRQGQILEDVEVEIRPVTESWDIGLEPTPVDIATRRYMVLRKVTRSTETGESPTLPQRAALARLVDESTIGGRHLATESMRPTRRGRRYVNTRDGISVYDGPFAETKELLGGYMIVSAASIDAADRWARDYIQTVGAEEVQLRELE